MKIEAHIIGWNIWDTVEFTIWHYLKFCQKVIFYDNYSDDGTFERFKYWELENRIEVKRFGVPGSLDDGEYRNLKNNCWKGSDADYVIVCDNDELLYWPLLEKALEERPTIVKTQGFNMIANDLDWTLATQGAPDNNYSKLVCFSPKLKEINYVYGCHVAKPVGEFRLSKTVVPLLHYRSVGGVERLIERQRQYVARMSPLNHRWGLGSHYKESEEQKRREWKDLLERSETLLEDGIFSPSILTRLTQRQEE